MDDENCKYCGSVIESFVSEHMKCNLCKNNVHLKCLRKGAVPGGLCGDVFYRFTCQECSPTCSEIFERDKMPWYRILIFSCKHVIFISTIVIGCKQFY